MAEDSLNLSPRDRAAVLDTLQAILASPHFRKSKRYPALLDYSVRHTLDRDFNQLKERIVGAEVFGRPADYDTNDDPVVRIAAGEVRKRIALYFNEHPDSPVRIDLPIGSYVAEFRILKNDAAIDSGAKLQSETASARPVTLVPAPDAGPVSAGVPAPQPSRKFRASHRLVISIGTILCLVAGVAAWRYFQLQKEHQFWWPVLHNASPAVILVGQMPPNPGAQGSQAGSPTPDTLTTENRLPEHQLVMGNAIAAADVCGVFRVYGRPCSIIPARSAKLADVRNKSIVLIGAFDNPWTRRLLAPLRYQFVLGPQTAPPNEKLRSIVDKRQAANGSPWNVDFNSSPEQESKDYFIIARFHSDTTDSIVLVAAGIGPNATRSAGDFVAASDQLAQITSLAPASWKGLNVEAVLQTEIVQGQPGHVKILATEFW